MSELTMKEKILISEYLEYAYYSYKEQSNEVGMYKIANEEMELIKSIDKKLKLAIKFNL